MNDTELANMKANWLGYWPTFIFDYKEKHYTLPFKLGCQAGIRIVGDSPTLYGGYTEKEIIGAIGAGTLKPADQPTHPVPTPVDGDLFEWIDNKGLCDLLSYDATEFKKELKQRISAHLQAAVREAEDALLNKLLELHHMSEVGSAKHGTPQGGYEYGLEDAIALLTPDVYGALYRHNQQLKKEASK